MEKHSGAIQLLRRSPEVGAWGIPEGLPTHSPPAPAWGLPCGWGKSSKLKGTEKFGIKIGNCLQ